MNGFDRAILAEKAGIVERHLRRVAERLPASPEDLRAFLAALATATTESA